MYITDGERSTITEALRNAQTLNDLKKIIGAIIHIIPREMDADEEAELHNLLDPNA